MILEVIQVQRSVTAVVYVRNLLVVKCIHGRVTMAEYAGSRVQKVLKSVQVI